MYPFDEGEDRGADTGETTAGLVSLLSPHQPKRKSIPDQSNPKERGVGKEEEV